jgi:hypothetical protein
MDRWHKYGVAFRFTVELKDSCSHDIIQRSGKILHDIVINQEYRFKKVVICFAEAQKRCALCDEEPRQAKQGKQGP